MKNIVEVKQWIEELGVNSLYADDIDKNISKQTRVRDFWNDSENYNWAINTAAKICNQAKIKVPDAHSDIVHEIVARTLMCEESGVKFVSKMVNGKVTSIKNMVATLIGIYAKNPIYRGYEKKSKSKNGDITVVPASATEFINSNGEVTSQYNEAVIKISMNMADELNDLVDEKDIEEVLWYISVEDKRKKLGLINILKNIDFMGELLKGKNAECKELFKDIMKAFKDDDELADCFNRAFNFSQKKKEEFGKLVQQYA